MSQKTWGEGAGKARGLCLFFASFAVFVITVFGGKKGQGNGLGWLECEDYDDGRFA